MGSSRRLSLNLAIGNQKKPKLNPKNYGEITGIVHEISIPTLKDLDVIRKKHMRQLELKQTPLKRKVQTLFPKRPVIHSAANLTIVTEEATNQPTPTPLIAFRKPF